MLCRWYTELCLKAQSLCNSRFSSSALLSSCFDQWLISSSFILTLDITLLFLHSEGYYTLQTSVSVCYFIYTAVSMLSPTVRSTLVWAPSHFTDLTWILTPQPSRAIALLRSLNNTWIYPFFIKSDDVTLTFAIQQHCYPSIFCQLNIIFLFLQLYKEIEISPKATKVIRFDKAESCSIGYGRLVSFWTTWTQSP